MFDLLSVKVVYSSSRSRYSFWQIMKSLDFVISCSHCFLSLQCWNGWTCYHSSNESDGSHELDCSPSHRAWSQYEQVWKKTSHLLSHFNPCSTTPSAHLGMLFFQPDSSYFLTFSFFMYLLCFYATTPARRSSCQAFFFALQAWCLLICLVVQHLDVLSVDVHVELCCDVTWVRDLVEFKCTYWQD